MFTSHSAHIVQLFLASEALFISAIFVAKAGVLLTVESLLARDMTVRIVFRCTLGAVAVMGLGSLLAITIGCGSHSLLTEETAQCSQVSCSIQVSAERANYQPGISMDRSRDNRFG